MFSLFEESKQRIPIYVWLDDIGELDDECRRQAVNLSNLPFAYHHIALMPDTHVGYGMPVGGILAAEGTVVPNAVGVDIGCGICFVDTDLPSHSFDISALRDLVNRLMKKIPTGFDRHKVKKRCEALARFSSVKRSAELLLREIPEGYFQVGTLGGGNHFIEIQKDESGKICLMVHSGSRNFGFKIAQYFNAVAKKENRNQDVSHPPSSDLAYLPIHSYAGADYIQWMHLALDFAEENRRVMMDIIKEELELMMPGVHFGIDIDCHHNYAARESHYCKDLWIHRKGAIRSQQGEFGIIPGAMGSHSYIVVGEGHPESFNSSPHGAGRRMGRKQAIQAIPAHETLKDLTAKQIVLGKRKIKDISEESPHAYKDVELVLEQANGLVTPIRKLMTMAVIKG
jgi:tRNA-splicing ligase RtcB